MPSTTSRLIHVHCMATAEDYVQVTLTDDSSALTTDAVADSISIQLSKVPLIQRLRGCLHLLVFGHIYSKTQITPATALELADKLRTEAEGIIELQFLRANTDVE